jgi:hypothetical protein
MLRPLEQWFRQRSPARTDFDYQRFSIRARGQGDVV